MAIEFNIVWVWIVNIVILALGYKIAQLENKIERLEEK